MGLDLDECRVIPDGEQGTWYIPTLAVYYVDWSPERHAGWASAIANVRPFTKIVQESAQGAIEDCFGTDVGGFPWTEPIAQEFALIGEFGHGADGAIRSATSRRCRTARRQGTGRDSCGSIRGHRGVWRRSAADIHELEHVRFVRKAGKGFKNEMK